MAEDVNAHHSTIAIMSLSPSTDELISLNIRESDTLDTSPMECNDASPSSMVPLSDLCLTSSSSPATPMYYEPTVDSIPSVTTPTVSAVSVASIFGKTNMAQAMSAVAGNRKPLSVTICTNSNALPLPSQFRCDMKMAVSTTDTTRQTQLVNGSSNSTKELCKVCGDESSGFHYGVNSCEGCKGFFRRCITQGMTHKCSNSEKCEVTPFTRNTCQYCRLKKCFAVGMSREASRLGRRPKKLKEPGNELRSHNVAIAPYPCASELYRLRMAELQRLLQQNGTFKTELMQAFISAQQSAEQHGTQFVPTCSGVNMAQINTGTIIVENGNPIIPGSESGYSSMSSPASSKSQSPIQVSSQMPNLLLTNGNNNPNNPEMLMNVNNVTPGMMVNNRIMMPCMGGLPEGFDPSSFSIPGLPADFIEAQIQMVSNSPLSENGIPVEMPASMLAPTSPTTPGIVIKQEMPFSSACLMNSGVISPGGSTGLPSGYNNNSRNTMSPSDMMSSMISANDLSNQNSLSNISQSHFVQRKKYPQQQDEHHLLVALSPKSSTAKAIDSYKNGSNNHDNKLDIEKIQREVKQFPNESRQKLIEQVTQSIIEAHMNTSRHTQQAVVEAQARIDEQKAANLLKDENKQSSEMWSQFVSNMGPEITLVVRFCKKLPGFVDINQEDQIVLIKQGAFECMLMRFTLFVDSKSYEMFDPDMKFKCSVEVIKKMPMGQFFEEFFGIADCFNPLEMTDGERGLYTAILIMCPDRPNLKNQRAVRKIQGLFLQSLYLLLQKNHSDYENLFLRLLNLLPVLRGINQQHSVALSNMKMMTPEKVEELPPLQREVFDV